jgi:hypothetical protein
MGARNVLASCPGLQAFGAAERADYGRCVALIGVYFDVQVAHVFGGNFSG